MTKHQMLFAAICASAFNASEVAAQGLRISDQLLKGAGAAAATPATMQWLRDEPPTSWRSLHGVTASAASGLTAAGSTGMIVGTVTANPAGVATGALAVGLGESVGVVATAHGIKANREQRWENNWKSAREKAASDWAAAGLSASQCLQGDRSDCYGALSTGALESIQRGQYFKARLSESLFNLDAEDATFIGLDQGASRLFEKVFPGTFKDVLGMLDGVRPDKALLESWSEEREGFVPALDGTCAYCIRLDTRAVSDADVSRMIDDIVQSATSSSTASIERVARSEDPRRRGTYERIQVVVPENLQSGMNALLGSVNAALAIQAAAKARVSGSQNSNSYRGAGQTSATYSRSSPDTPEPPTPRTRETLAPGRRF